MVCLYVCVLVCVFVCIRLCYIRYTPVVYGCVCVSVYVFTVVLHTLYACGVDEVDGVGGVAGVDGIGGVDGVDKWVLCGRHCAS